MNEQPKPSTSQAAASLENVNNDDESSIDIEKAVVKTELKSDTDDDRKAERVVTSAKEPDKCPVCLQVFSSIHSKSFTSKCFHSFCFECILEWSKVRYSCPLCKTDFDRIIYDLKSRLEFKEYTLKPKQLINPALDIIPIDPNTNVEQNQPAAAESKASWVIFHQLAPLTFRMMVYTKSWYASQYQTQTYVKITNIELESNNDQPQNQTAETITSDNLLCASYIPVTAHRDISPEWYQSNPASLHRLMQFIYRELKVLSAVLPSNSAERLNQKVRSQLINIITGLVKKIPLDSEEFVQKMCDFIRPTKYAKHFTHELVSYARSPCHSPVDYDAKVVYYKGSESIPRLNEKYSKNSHVVPFSSLPVCLNKYKLLTKPAVSSYVEYLDEYESYSTAVESIPPRPAPRSRSRSSSSSSGSSFCQELTPPRKSTPEYIVVSSSSGSSVESVHSSPTRESIRYPSRASSAAESTYSIQTIETNPKRLKSHHHHHHQSQSTSTNTSFTTDDENRPKTSKSSYDETRRSHRHHHSRKSKKKKKKKKKKEKKHDRHHKKHRHKSTSPTSPSV